MVQVRTAHLPLYVKYRDSFIQKLFHGLRDGMTNLYIPRAWGIRGCKYNRIALKPSAHLAIVPSTALDPTIATTAPSRRGCGCACCHHPFKTPTVDVRHTQHAFDRYIA